MQKTAHILSIIFSPMLLPAYGVAASLWLSLLVYLPLSTRLATLAVVVIMTCIIPAGGVLLLRQLGVVRDIGLNNRDERTAPYLITGVCYLGCMIYLIKVNAPSWLVMFMAGATLAVAVCLAVNLKWKISGHMTAMGGLIAILCRMAVNGSAAVNMFWPIIIAVVLTGMVGSARLILDRHTLLQAIAGTANGFLCVYLMSAITY